MHIVMAGCRGIPATYGGVEKVVEEISIRLAERGHKVTVLSRSHYVLMNSCIKGVNIVRLATINQKHLEMIVHMLISALYLTFKTCDLVHIHSVDPAIVSPWIRLFHPVVATSHGQAYRRKKWGWGARLASRIAEKVSIHVPNACTAVSRTLQKYYSSAYSRHIEYCPNGVIFRQPESVAKIQKFGLERESYILFVGRLIPTKGAKLLIDAYLKVDPDINLVIVGGSSHTDEYDKSIRKLAGERINFLGYQHGKTLNALYDHCRLFVFPSMIEGLPIVLLEALGALKPVIFSDIPENMEVANGLGISFKNGDVRDLSEKLSNALDNPRQLEAFKARIKSTLIEKYSWDSIVDKYTEVYQAVLDNEGVEAP